MLSILLYSLLAVARAAPSLANADGIDTRGVPIPGARVVPLFLDTQAFPDGPTLTLNGTIQEMRRQLLEINPNYDTDFNHTTTVEKRTNFFGAQLQCGELRWGAVKNKGYEEGVRYLRRLRGIPHMGPGPGACSRVSCSWSTGMWMCNDVSCTPAYDGVLTC